MGRLLHVAARLGRAHWRDLVEAQWLLVRTQLRLQLSARGTLLDAQTPTSGRPESAAPDRVTVERAAWAIDRVIAFGPLRVRCLARSIALRQLLGRRGIGEARVRVGVRRVDGRFEAHAWVELRGHVIGERAEHVRQFTVLSGLAMADDR